MSEDYINPYTTPNTPSDEITNKPSLNEEGLFVTDTGAYRENNFLFCPPAFIPPLMCLQTGVTKKSELEKTTISAGSISIPIYLTQERKSKIN